ncbi:hypothetical protein ACJ2A9_03880 [Anaerobacillus sp. MEB173]|uniref:hypothetical protein n=1 Tax=Anaerobacillus sp. MEB173 TaxID=3383345 RepID=UPI003F8DFDE8
MKNKEHQEQELLLKQLTRHFLKEQLNQLKGDNEVKNNSFIYLESKTLNMLLVYLLMDKITYNNPKQTNNDNNEFSDELLEELELVITNNKKDFEEIISHLKNNSFSN